MHSSAAAVAYRAPRVAPVLLLRESCAEPESSTDWTRVHERLVSLGKDRAAHERELGRWLCAADRLRVHLRAGYASLREYAERLVGLDGRQTEERLRVGRALAALPALDAALARGELRWSAVRELSRVATAGTEQAWLAWAKGRRLRDVERAVASRKPGEAPHDLGDPSLVKHRLRFEVRAETMALFRELESRVRADLGGAVDHDTLLFEIARRALGGPGDEGRASYQVAVTRCDACGGTSVEAGGESHPVDPAVAEMIACDAQEVRLARDAGPHVGRPRASQTIPPAVRREVFLRDRHRCIVPGCRNHRFLDVHHLDHRAEGGGHDPERLALLCGAHHRAVHTGTIRVDGRASEGFVVRHGDGTAYGRAVPEDVDSVRQALGALRGLGFKETQARAMVDGALRAGAPREVERLLHAALRGSPSW